MQLNIRKFSIGSFLFLINLPLLAQGYENANHIRQFLTLEEGQNIYLKVSAGLAQGSLVEITKDLKVKGVNVEFSKIERDANNLITHIVMDVKVGDYQKRIESANQGKPINDPLIFYFLSLDNMFGLSAGLPNDLPRNELKKFNSFSGLVIGMIK